MKRTTLVAALVCAVMAPGAIVRAQEWSGSAGVAAMRGYTASSGLSMTAYGAGSVPPPAEAEAMAAPPPAVASGRPIGDLAGDVPHRRRMAGARARRGHDGRRLRRA